MAGFGIPPAEALALGLENLLAPYTLQVGGVLPNKPLRQRAALNMSGCFLAFLQVSSEFLRLASTGVTLRQFLLQATAALPVSPSGEQRRQEIIRRLEGYRSSRFLAADCQSAAGSLDIIIRQVEATVMAGQGRPIGYRDWDEFDFPPQQTALLRSLEGGGEVDEGEVIARVYGAAACRSTSRKALKNRLGKLVFDTKQNLLLFKIDRTISRKAGKSWLRLAPT